MGISRKTFKVWLSCTILYWIAIGVIINAGGFFPARYQANFPLQPSLPPFQKDAGWQVDDPLHKPLYEIIRSPSAEKLDRITTFFDHEVATGKLPGAVVLIQQHGRPIYLKCFGVRDVATRRLMTPDTIFALHSMTKPITSVAAMMLIDAGKLALQDSVSKFIPSFADVKVLVEATAADGSRSSPCEAAG